MSDTQLKSRTVESLSGEVLDRVAACKNTEPTELEPPLYEVIDPDALDEIFTPKRNGRARTGGQVRFTYCGYEIQVTSNGEVRAEPTEK